MPYKDLETRRAKAREYTRIYRARHPFVSTPEYRASERRRGRNKPRHQMLAKYERQKNLRQVDPLPSRRAGRKSSLKSMYGLTECGYEQLAQSQGHVCAICRKPETCRLMGRTVRLSVDHCHVTGKIRGLLCKKCNSAIGFCGEDIERLEAATAYLRASHEG